MVLQQDVYSQMSEEEAKEHKPKVVFMNDDNTINEITNYEYND